MANIKKMVFLMIVCVIFSASSLAQAAYVWDSVTDPNPNVPVDASNPHFFSMDLPGWDLGHSDYTQATFQLTAVNAISIWAAVPIPDPVSDVGLYTIPLCTAPDGALSVTQFDLLTALSSSEFDALFMGQTTLYLVANLNTPSVSSILQTGSEPTTPDYYFKQATLTLETVPIPGAVWLLASGLIGLVGIRRRTKWSA